ncbi:MAG TPA: alkaline phosphatase family protein [Steroidobacteraceae bacterium]|jgi:phospholipase C
MAIIQHVVVLMLENRSFDSMLGRLYPDDPNFRGLTLREFNDYNGTGYGVWNDTGMDATAACIPDPDPGEFFSDMTLQLFGQAARGPGTAPMNGFAQSYATQKGDGVFAPSSVMHYFTPQQVPIISTLAKAFGVCDAWHASAPCQTWPNRFFAHTATSLGYVDNKAFPIPFDAASIFRRLEDQEKSWRVYFHDMPQSMLLKDVWLYAASRYRVFSQFLADAQTGSLPSYSFIEPRYFADLFGTYIPNDEHPPHNVVYGEQLIASVYNALRSSPCWKQTLFIITYDEHGGCFDHVAPPKAVPPDGKINNAYGFDFSAYGVRVPAVIISPYMAPGSKLHEGRDGTPFDHTSIIRTVRDVFGLGGPLTARDAAAPSLMEMLDLALPTNDGPLSVDASLISAPPAQVATRAAAPLNGMQSSLAAAATQLPRGAPTSSSQVPSPSVPPTATYPTVATAAASASASTKLFLGL